MPNKHFFLSYGGPGGAWFSDIEDVTKTLKDACKRTYGWPRKETTYMIKGLELTVCTYGVHRALHVKLPNNASQQTKNLYNQIETLAQQIRLEDNKYAAFSYNCVTAVARVMSLVDNKTAPTNVAMPWSLDSYLNKYCGSYAVGSKTEEFITAYQDKVNKESLSFFRKHHWSKNRITKEADIAAHAYGGKTGSGERTKSTLLELGWVTEDKNHTLHPAAKASNEFRDALNKYNRINKKEVDKTHGTYFQV